MSTVQCSRSIDFRNALNPHGLRFVEGGDGNNPPADPPQGPQRPEGVSEQEWDALGDPGKAAIVRERERASAAERALAAERAKVPKPAPPKADPPSPSKSDDDQPDIAAIIKDAVAQAVKPFQDAQAQAEADRAATAIADAVTAAAKDRFHDPSDALAGIDLTGVTDGNGRPDQTKIDDALKDLLTRKPHLGKPDDGRRRPPAGAPVGAGGGSSIPLDDRVKATLARMQSASGVKFAD